MSMMCCNECGAFVDTDDDPESLYVFGHDGKCICESCREAIEEFNYGGDMYRTDQEEHGTYYGNPERR